MKVIDKQCPDKYKPSVSYQGCPYCGGKLIKEMVEPFQQQGYYRCSFCNFYASLLTIIKLRR